MLIMPITVVGTAEVCKVLSFIYKAWLYWLPLLVLTVKCLSHVYHVIS